MEIYTISLNLWELRMWWLCRIPLNLSFLKSCYCQTYLIKPHKIPIWNWVHSYKWAKLHLVLHGSSVPAIPPLSQCKEPQTTQLGQQPTSILGWLGAALNSLQASCGFQLTTWPPLLSEIKSHEIKSYSCSPAWKLMPSSEPEARSILMALYSCTGHSLQTIHLFTFLSVFKESLIKFYSWQPSRLWLNREDFAFSWAKKIILNFKEIHCLFPDSFSWAVCTLLNPKECSLLEISSPSNVLVCSPWKCHLPSWRGMRDKKLLADHKVPESGMVQGIISSGFMWIVIRAHDILKNLVFYTYIFYIF